LQAARWLSESFHNSWLKSLPKPSMLEELLQYQKSQNPKGCGIFDEKTVDWETS